MVKRCASRCRNFIAAFVSKYVMVWQYQRQRKHLWPPVMSPCFLQIPKNHFKFQVLCNTRSIFHFIYNKIWTSKKSKLRWNFSYKRPKRTKVVPCFFWPTYVPQWKHAVPHKHHGTEHNKNTLLYSIVMVLTTFHYSYTKQKIEHSTVVN